MKLFHHWHFTFVVVTLVALPARAIDDHLLLSEVAVQPSQKEFVEIVNPTASAVDLSQYYLSDDEDYALLPGTFGAGPVPDISSSDFIARFPAGASLGARGVAVVAMDGAGFRALFGFAADYEVLGTDAGTPDMIAVDVGATAGLTNTGENVVLFRWDGASDLVDDVDMLNVGQPTTTNNVGNKTGVSVDGPDADLVASTYVSDAFAMPQQLDNLASGTSTKRILREGANEVTGSGNGTTSDDETTENILVTWEGPPFSPPTPGTADFWPSCW